jgi:hypothetical protein
MTALRPILLSRHCPVLADRRPTTERLEPGISHIGVSLRSPAYRENSHANHTWHPPSHKTACFHALDRCPCGFDSHRPLHFQARQATQGYKIGVKTLIRWDSLGNWRRGGGGLMASRIPASPRDSHVQSHAAVHKNKLWDSHAPLVCPKFGEY